MTVIKSKNRQAITHYNYYNTDRYSGILTQANYEISGLNEQ